MRVVVISGDPPTRLCEEVMECEAVIRSLVEVPAGLSVRVQEIDGPAAVRARLCALGITPGTVIAIFPSSGKEALRICVRGSSLVLSKDLAGSIKCTVLTHGCCRPEYHGRHAQGRGGSCPRHCKD